MISANECKENTRVKEEQNAKYAAEQTKKIRENTLEFCNTVLTKQLDSASKAGLHSITLHFLSSGWYDSYHLIHKVSSYWHIESYQWRDLDAIKEMAEMHGYTVEVKAHVYKKSSTKQETGKAIIISW